MVATFYIPDTFSDFTPSPFLILSFVWSATTALDAAAFDVSDFPLRFLMEWKSTKRGNF